MDDGISRRGLIAGSAGAGLLALADTSPATAATVANPAGLALLVSTDGVTVPARGDGAMKFSWSVPEPSVDFAGFRFAFELLTYENRYSVDPATVRIERGDGRLRFVADGLTWAGGSEHVPGGIEAVLTRDADGAVAWTLSGRFDRPIKALKTIVRGLPRGRLSTAAGDWRDWGDDEKVFEYPALMGGMATPLMAIEGRDGRVWGISSCQDAVRPARFMVWPGPDGYKLELVAEPPAWERAHAVTVQPWRIASGADFAAVARPHFAHVARAWKLPAFAERADAPGWMKHLGLVLSLHGQHWSGYILNDYDRQREILRWVARRTDPHTTMVFLAGWDGRYYWDYPAFRPDPRMGGEAGFARLVQEAHRLGYRVAGMFGSNIANPASPLYPGVADALLRTSYGVPFAADYVDWDGDWKGDASMAFMNLAVPSWRDHLAGRIDDMIARHGLDAYFLDICGLWENNPQGDMLEGTRALVAGLATRHPGVPAIAEMQYDAQMGFIPMSHVPRYRLFPEANYGVVASFDHLSHPAPGRGSTGVHEAGFGNYRPVTPDQRQIPTITFSDDTLARHADLVARDIATANARFAARGGRT